MVDIVTTPDDATQRATHVPPQLVLDVQKNPELLRPVARAMSAIHLHTLYERLTHPGAAIKDKLEFQNMLNKLSGLDSKDTFTGNTGPQVIINITRAKDRETMTIEGTAVRVADGTPD